MRCAGLSPRIGLDEDRNHGGADMAQVRTWVGADVHAAKVVAAIADSESGELVVRRMGGATEQVAEFCVSLPAPVRVAYEAGPTGFGLARALQKRGIACVVAAPGKIERPAQDRVKTERLVRLLMIGGLHRCGCRARPRRRCATWSGPARMSAAI
jgi:transposase